MSNNSLLGVNVIITRSSHQAEELKKKILALRGIPIIFPTLEINPVQNPQLENILTNINNYDLLIFTSINAVLAVAPSLSKSLQSEVAAIGPATAAALQKLDIDVNWQPQEKFDSEHLLMLPALNNVTGKKIVIFGGVGGRQLLSQALKKRGAEVIKVVVYKRICPRPSSEQFEKLLQLEKRVIISTSCESLNNLFNIMANFQKKSWLLSTPLVIISERMKKDAIKLGFRKEVLVQAENATDQAILETLIKWYANQH